MLNRPTPAAPRLLVLLSWSLAIAGCGDSGPTLARVDGTVTLDGKPVEGATVSFQPALSNSEGRPAEGLTGTEGSYRTLTDGRAGVIPGKYHVVVTKLSERPESVAKAPTSQVDPAMARFTAGLADQRGRKPAGTIEAAFDREVPPEGGVLDFDIKGKAATGK